MFVTGTCVPLSDPSHGHLVCTIDSGDKQCNTSDQGMYEVLDHIITDYDENDAVDEYTPLQIIYQYLRY